MVGTGVRIPVAIVGGGPVGLMLALFLDLHGVRSVPFNTEETTRWHPKGNTHNARTTEIREFYGCDLALVRPDQHVAWRGNKLPPDAAGLLARLVGSAS